MGRLTRWITGLVWVALALALVATAAFAMRWRSTQTLNAMIRDRSVGQLSPLPADLRVRYAAAWDLERAQHFDEAVKLFNQVQAAKDPKLAANAWFALGNAYFESGIKMSRDVKIEGPVIENTQFDLARDAYRAALRIDPFLRDVRYNLELLERLSPPPPGEGWRRNTDPITIQPDRHNGWTTIQESAKRGLP